MALLYTYYDSFLAPYCTEERETRATAEVTLLADGRTLSAEWTEKLTILQTYIIACIESQAENEDLFEIKLQIYRDELALQLPRAQAAADETANTVSSVYSIPVWRA